MLALLACCGNAPAVRTGFAQSATSGSDRRAPAGPVFVPADSWAYPALLRLAALGYITGQTAGMRPWTRNECQRQLAEAEYVLSNVATSSAHYGEAFALVQALREELNRQPRSSAFLELESVYSRYLGIAGRPLNDGYNFGQTVINDYGRPIGQGSNLVGGFSGDAVAGRFSFYARGEYEQSPSFSSPAAALKPSVPQLEPVLFGAPGGLKRLEPLEAYVGVQLGNWAITAGKQDIWWGAGQSGPLSLGDNAAPFYSIRATTASPFLLPGFLKALGSFRLDLIGGELSDHHFPARPLLNAQKLTWNPTRDLELGFTRWSLFDGTGVHGFTIGSVLRNLTANSATYGAAVDPGDRKSGFDFLWRPPLPGRPISLYSEFYADDEPSPLASFRRSGFSPGIYIASLPRLSRWDLRVEAPSTRLATSDQGGRFLYWNSVYHDANTNAGTLLGNWVGRDGRGLLIQSAWWRSPRSKIEFGYRQNRIGPAFLPGGGTQDSGSVAVTVQNTGPWRWRVAAQYERYNLPILGPSRRDLALSLEFVYTPHWQVRNDQQSVGERTQPRGPSGRDWGARSVPGVKAE